MSNRKLLHVPVGRRPHVVKDRSTGQYRAHVQGKEQVFVYETVAIERKEYNERLKGGTLEEHLEGLHFKTYGRPLQN